MRTPGDDFDLVHGFLVTEGVIAGAGDVAGAAVLRPVDADGRNTYNVVDVDLAPGRRASRTPALERNFYTSSSCGVCGKASIDAVRTKTRLRRGRRRRARCPWRCCSRCPTGCGPPSRCSTGPAACTRPACSPPPVNWWRCARTSAGTTPSTRSSGAASARAGCRCPGQVLMVSGRASFELTQKAAMAGIPVLAAVSAPWSLAVELAARGRHHAGRLPARRRLQRLHAPGTDRPPPE